jgi:hypothetical protein
MLFWIYNIITIGLAFIIGIELFDEKKWRIQIALALISIPLILRVLGVK